MFGEEEVIPLPQTQLNVFYNRTYGVNTSFASQLSQTFFPGGGSASGWLSILNARVETEEGIGVNVGESGDESFIMLVSRTMDAHF